MPSFASHSLSKAEVSRFSRQLILHGIGPAGQEKIRDASVLIVGAGGLGCPVAIYLAAAGVGRLGVVDHDEVSLDNLHRQILHDEIRVGRPKVESLKESILRLNSGTEVATYPVVISSVNAFNIIPKYDIICDCSDNVATRYLINDACVLSGKPLVSGSALGWEGQLTVYNNGEKCPCYRCIFPVPPAPEAVSNCSESGVLGPVVGIIGSLQALEVIKIAVGRESSFAGNLWLFDGFEGKTRTICLREKMTRCAVCGENPTITELQDYEQFCGTSATDKVPSISVLSPEERISVQEYNQLRQQSGSPTLIDTRPPTEFEICHLPEAQNIPLDELKKLDTSTLLARLANEEMNENSDASNKTVYVVCHRGNDSQLAVKLLQEKLTSADASIQFMDLVGGMDSWAVDVDTSFPRY
ncbi:Adenylyltransferase and sulfurtransferase MOCS3 [Aphelenchoides avenae]|nr:Adenylyltransferase and sulfurtransferase MOCS3 [Aphelenchus avenae]